MPRFGAGGPLAVASMAGAPGAVAEPMPVVEEMATDVAPAPQAETRLRTLFPESWIFFSGQSRFFLVNFKGPRK